MGDDSSRPHEPSKIDVENREFLYMMQGRVEARSLYSFLIELSRVYKWTLEIWYNITIKTVIATMSS